MKCFGAFVQLDSIPSSDNPHRRLANLK